MNSKAIRKQLLAAIAMVLVAAVALSSSTYAWFVNNAQVTATNVNVTATTAYSLQIKKGSTGNYGTTTDLNGAVTLKPVSTVGALASAEKELKAAGANPSTQPAVGIGDNTTVAKNDMVFFTSDSWNSDAEVITFKEVSKNSTHSYVNGPSGSVSGTSKYFYSDTVYLKAGQASKIYLDNTTTGIYDGSTVNKFSSYTKVDTTSLSGEQLTAANAKNATVALLETMRVGFVVTKGSGESATRTVFIYQLNDGDSGTGYRYNTTMSDAEGITKATDSENSVGALSSVTNYSSGIIALKDAVMATGAQTSMATAPTTDAAKNTLATVAANEEIQVDIYMWMEGCDHDTTAANSAQFQTTIQGIQFGFCIGAAA